MNHQAEIFIPVTFMVAAVIIVFFTLKFNHETRRLIIEKGGDVPIRKRTNHLEGGLTMIGIGLGLGIASLLHSLNLPHQAHGLLTGACVLFFGGLGAISAFFVRRKLDAKEQD